MGMTANVCCCCGRNTDPPDCSLNFVEPTTNINTYSLDENEFFKLIPNEIINKMNKVKFPDNKNKAIIKTEKILVMDGTNSEYEENGKELFYHGEYNQQGQKDGIGKMVIKENKQKKYYQGVWRNGDLNEGYIYYENGSEYKGEIKNYMRDGKGHFKTKNDNEIYNGDWKEDNKEGEGELIFKDGTRYMGGFQNDKFNGKGKMEWKNGIYYDGEFMNDYLHGKGYLRGNNGHIYNGYFENGYYHGEGEFKWINGMSVEIYKGNYSYGIKDGFGEFHFENGDIYRGGWKSGNPDGQGTYETNNRKYFGNWRAGIFMQLFEVEDKQEAKEENLDLTFKTPNEDIVVIDHISTSYNTAITEKSSEAELVIEYIKHD
jgi:hypothetical protein